MIGVMMAWKIEIEDTDGVVGFYKGGRRFDTAVDADAVAEKLWLNWSGRDEILRFTVVDSAGVTYSDWEC
jgi:hypothetical protein